MTPSKDRDIVGLQALRAVAALTVVIHHALRAVTVNAGPDLDVGPSVVPGWLAEAGAGGVDVFFVLSGFLMVYIAGSYVQGRRPVTHFLQQRVLRIWPLYALVTLWALKPALMNLYVNGVQGFDLSPHRLLGFFLVPTFNEKGLIQPIVGVGWTLSYEALFYLCFAAAIVLVRRHLFPGLCAVLAVVFGLGLLLPADSVGHGFLANTLTLEFLYGAAIASFVNWRTHSTTASLALIALGVALFLLTAVFDLMDLPYRPFTWGVAAAAAFVGVLGLEGKVRWPRFVVMLGNASYSIYLVHILVIYQVLMPYSARALRKFDLHLQADVLALGFVVVAVAGGVLCHFAIERPLTRWLMRRGAGQRPVDLPVSLTRP